MPPTETPEQKGFLENILAHKAAFVIVFFIIFILTYGILIAIDFIPETPKEEEEPVTMIEAKQEEIPLAPAVVVDPYPTRIFIDSLDKDIKILNPESREVTDLDTALFSGVVRHPDSADFATVGTMFLFGHSSYLPHVFNKNFQAFNEIQKLVWGDIIRLQSSDTEYRYRVSKVYKTKAGDADVALEHDSAKLTLVTCNSFGSKDERFVVEAELVETRAL
jgi:LPXTG-site transpeptidase (sortase) family protein